MIISPLMILVPVVVVIGIIAIKLKKLAEIIGIVSSTVAGFLLGLISWNPVSMGLAFMGALIGLVVSIAVISLAYVFKKS